MRSKLTEKQYDWRKIAVLLLLPVLCCMLTAFDRYIPELSYTARDVIEAIIQEDWETVMQFRDETCPEEKYADMIEQAGEHLAGLPKYRFMGLDYAAESKVMVITMEVYTPDHSWLVEVQGNEKTQRISEISVTGNGEPTRQVIVSGSLMMLGESNSIQKMLGYFSALEFAFILLTLFDCGIRRVKRPVLWPVLIGLGVFSIGLLLAKSGPEFQFSIVRYSRYTAWLKYWNETNEVRLMVPFGAILYWIYRKKISVKLELPPVRELVDLDYEQYMSYSRKPAKDKANPQSVQKPADPKNEQGR